MRTDTLLIPVIEGEAIVLHQTEVCAWCRIKLTAIPDRPILYADARYHPGCVFAAHAAMTPTQPLRVV